jgi:Fe-S cluster assembly scaffold protein SufB
MTEQVTAPSAVDRLAGLGGYEYGWSDSDVAGSSARRGLGEDVVRDISAKKHEPEWMLDLRLKGLRLFGRKPLPAWGADLGNIDFDNIKYFVRSTEKQAASWDELPADIKNTYDRLGIPEAEKQRLVAGVAAQYESEVVYHKIREDLEQQGVIFLDTDTGLKEHPELFQEYFGTVIPVGDNKFAALNTAVWSGGCLTADARINVKGKGLVSIADIEPGDEVFGVNTGRDLERGKVLGKVASGVKPVYEIRVAGRTLEATGNHQFLVARRVKNGDRMRWVAVWVPLDEIEVGEPVSIARVLPDDGASVALPEPEAYLKNHSRRTVSTPKTTNPELCWLLGLWLGDGHTAAPHEHMRQVSFSVPIDDPAYGLAMAVLRRQFGVERVTPVKCGFIVSSKALGTWLEDLGFAGHAATKRLPTWVFSLPHEEQLALLGGLVDADGWTEDDGATMSIELSNRELLEDVRQLAIGCGLYADGRVVERTRTQTFKDDHTVTATSRRLRIQGDLSRILTRDPYKRGKEATKGRGKRYTAATGLNFSALATDTVGFALLQSKVPVGEKPTYDIQVVGLENFVANGIVAHNSFIYVPKGVHVEIPLQAYFRINTENMGQFERTLIIVDEGAYVHYVEGCTAPIYSSDSLHSAVVEIIVKKNARCRYTTIQNWSTNVYNLVTKRAVAHEGATMEWVDGNLGSKVTMKYPAVFMVGEHAKGEVLSVAMAGQGQHQDAGAKMVHAAPHTSSTIVSKSIARGGGRTSYRGLVQVLEGSHHSRSTVKCDALLVDTVSRSDTYPYVDVREDDVAMGHEATVSKVSDEQLFYLMSRGLTEDEAMAMIVRGFIEPIAKELPMEYALELNRLIELQMEGAVG